jgi:hypothetical protein
VTSQKATSSLASGGPTVILWPSPASSDWQCWLSRRSRRARLISPIKVAPLNGIVRDFKINDITYTDAN